MPGLLQGTHRRLDAELAEAVADFLVRQGLAAFMEDQRHEVQELEPGRVDEAEEVSGDGEVAQHRRRVLLPCEAGDRFIAWSSAHHSTTPNARAACESGLSRDQRCVRLNTAEASRCMSIHPSPLP